MFLLLLNSIKFENVSNCGIQLQLYPTVVSNCNCIQSNGSPRGIVAVPMFSTPALLRVSFLKIQNGGGFDARRNICAVSTCPLAEEIQKDTSFLFGLEHLIPNAKVGHAHMDYERGLISAFEHSHNLAERHGCFAHYARALYRRVQKLDLVQIYKREGRLSCARNPDGSSIFVIGSAEKKLISYFKDVDLGGSYRRKINVSNKPLELLCFDCERQIKDKEFSRGWHNTLKLALASSDGKKPRFWKWLRKLKQECSMMEAQLVSMRGTPKKLRLEDQRIAIKRKRISENYNRERVFEYVMRRADLTVLNQFLSSNLLLFTM
uniref:Uncharacterized protein n=1 Tax=Ditylenchus dipsaci TaxID=166011 RepID=A0A915CWG7_9BILA